VAEEHRFATDLQSHHCRCTLDAERFLSHGVGVFAHCKSYEVPVGHQGESALPRSSLLQSICSAILSALRVLGPYQGVRRVLRGRRQHHRRSVHRQTGALQCARCEVLTWCLLCCGMTGNNWDATELVRTYDGPSLDILIDQGTRDKSNKFASCSSP